MGENSANVYYNPPEGFSMRYPCVVYSLTRMGSQPADNIHYLRSDSYQVTHIYRHDSDSGPSREMAAARGFSFDRSFRSDNLYHDVFTYLTY